MRNDFYIQEAFSKLKLLNEDAFDFSKDAGVEDKLTSFAADDVDYKEEPIIDTEAETESDLQDTYVGKVILECNCCHSRIYKDEDEVVIDEEEGSANVDETCPVCGGEYGYTVIGKIEPFDADADPAEAEDEEPVEVDLKDSEGNEEDKAEEEEDSEGKKLSDEAVESFRKYLRGEKALKESKKNGTPPSDKRLNEADIDFDKGGLINKIRSVIMSFKFTKALINREGAERASAIGNRIAEIAKEDPMRAVDIMSNYIDVSKLYKDLGLYPDKTQKAFDAFKDARFGYDVDSNFIDKYDKMGSKYRDRYPHLRGEGKPEEESLMSEDRKKIDPYLKNNKPMRKDNNILAHTGAVKKVFEIIDNMSDEEFDILADNSWDAYMEHDPQARRVIKKLFTKYGLPMWALTAFAEHWDDQLLQKQERESFKSSKGKRINEEELAHGNDQIGVRDDTSVEDDKSLEDDQTDLYKAAFEKRDPINEEARSRLASIRRKINSINEALDDVVVNTDEGSVEVSKEGEKVIVDFSGGEGGMDETDPMDGEMIAPLGDEDISSIEGNEPEGEMGGEMPMDDMGGEPMEGGEEIPGEEPAEGGEEMPMGDEEEPIGGEEEGEIPEGGEEEEEIPMESLSSKKGNKFFLEGFDMSGFEKMADVFMHRVYENVNKYSVSRVGQDDSNGNIIVEGIINFNSGKKSPTTFTFNSISKTKSDKVVLEGVNTTFSKSKAFRVRGSLNNKQYIPESFTYNFSTTALNESNKAETVKVHGRVKR